MERLSQLSCEACRADAPKVSDAELGELMQQIPNWQPVCEAGILQLKRQYAFANFVDALAFTGKVSELAEQFNHHPAITTEWGKCTVVWWTHKIKGLHKNDFIMAAKTEALFEK